MRPKVRLSTLMAVLAVVLLAATVAATAEPSDVPEVPWKTVAASGGVEARSAVNPEPAWQAVHRGDELQPETLVRTGRRGRATLTRVSSVLIVDSSTTVELPSRSYSTLETSVIQTEGSVLYEVDGRENPHFEVVTPYLIAGVKGTAFLVTVQDGYTSVTVERGLVEVTDRFTGEVMDVPAGESLIRETDGEAMELMSIDQSRKAKRTRRDVKTLERLDKVRDVQMARAPTGRKALDESIVGPEVHGKDWTGELERSMGSDREAVLSFGALTGFGDDLFQRDLDAELDNRITLPGGPGIGIGTPGDDDDDFDDDDDRQDLNFRRD